MFANINKALEGCTMNFKKFVFIIPVSLSLLIVLFLYRVGEWPLDIPYAYGGDSLSMSMWIKTIIEKGWFLENDSIGYPFGLTMYDYPVPDTFIFLCFKVISFFTDQYSVILNLYYLLTFPVTTLTAYFVFRHFSLNFLSSSAASILFTFLPFHFMRGEYHLFLTSYYTIPLAVLVLLWVCKQDNEFIRKRDRKISFFFNKKILASFLICILFGSTEVYYAFFFCFLLIIAGLHVIFKTRKLFPIFNVSGMILVIAVSLLINISPSIVYKLSGNSSAASTHRNAVESEIYGLKIPQLILPVSGHNIGKLDELKSRYNQNSININENDTATLGIIGTVGLVLSICFLLFNIQTSYKVKILSTFNLSCILLAVTGGVGSLFAIYISPQIRAYNRISVFVAFFSIFILFYYISKLEKKNIKLYSTYVLIILCLGLMDQIPKSVIKFGDSLQMVRNEYENDKKFVSNIENMYLKDEINIFQFPIVPFPEVPPIHKLRDYDLFKGYLHSKKINWSYGNMKGGLGDIWQRNLETKEIDEILEEITIVGFDGIYIDRFAFEDDAALIISNLEKILGTQPLISDNQRLVYFDMSQFNEATLSKFSENELVKKRNAILNPLYIVWGEGFYGLEQYQADSWRWSNKNSELVIKNFSNVNQRVSLDFVLISNMNSKIVVDSDILKKEYQIDQKGFLSVTEIVNVPPGEFKIKISTNSPKIDAPNDPRDLYFRVMNFRYENIPMEG